MSVIEKMSIMGIRSFGPEDHNRQMIEFFKPLTLILGPNGSGKTTIIECLRYITTGDAPPNSDRGGSFVHDPKCAGEQEVKGQVKLQFRDVTGKKVVVTRSLMVSQSLKKLTLKTLEGNITRYGANNEKTHLSTRCAEMEAEMIGALGVSKAILNNVIFCHQEESNWPLSEGKALKQKFDEIFAATRYIKALEEIRKIRMDKMAEIKTHAAQVEFLVSNKKKSEEFRQDLDKTETRLSVCKDNVQDIENKLKPISEKLKEIKVKQNEIGKLQASLDSNLDLIKKYEKDEMHLRRSIKDLFSGTKDDLIQEMENFNSQVCQKKKRLEKIQAERKKSEKGLQLELKSRSRLQEELGKLKAEHERHKELIARRDSKLKQIRKSLGLGDLGFDDDELLDDSQVGSILSNLQKRNSATQNELQNCKAKHESNENRIQNSIEKTHIEKAQKQQKLSSSNEQVAKNKRAINNINSELSHLDSMASRQDVLEADLKEAEHELNSLEGKINVDECREEIARKQKKKDEIESRLNVLNQEMIQLQKESKIRTEIDLINKDINSKNEAIDKVLQRHKETIVHLLHEMPKDDIHEKITKLINTLNRKVHTLTKDLEKERSNLSSLETTKRFHENELESKEKTLAEYQNKIFEVCGSQDFDYGCDSLKNTIRELQDEKGALTGSLYLFNKYIEKLGKSRPCCPLCSRSFRGDDEAHSLISKLQGKLQSVPNSLEQKTKLISEKEKLLNRMLELKPVKDLVLNLAEKDIPELKRKLETVTADITASNSKILEMEDALDELSCDVKTASNIAPDLIILDQNQRELERFKRRLANLKTQIGGKDITRNDQQVREEQTKLQNEVKSINNEITKGQEDINNYREQMQQLRERVNNLNADKNQMCSDMQKKSSLLEQLENLGKENSELIEALKAIKTEIFSLDAKLKELTKEKDSVAKLKDKELEKIRIKIREEEREMESIESISKDINRYISDNKEKILTQHEEKLREISHDIDKRKEEQNKLLEQEEVLNKDINSQELKYRDLEDNKKLIEIIEDISQLNLKSQNLKKKIGGYNIRSLLNDLEKVQKEERELMKERDESVGRESILKEKIRSLKKQLEDDMFKDAEKKHTDKCIELRTTQVLCDDLSKYYTALNKAILSYHKLKMAEINKIIKDLWIKTYAGSDIDYIEIQSDEDSGGGLEKAKRQYNYRVVMFKGDIPIDMRGRCSAGQKVLASLIIRLALAETFCLNCGILALDEPTTNLDKTNISNLARALVE